MGVDKFGSVRTLEVEKVLGLASFALGLITVGALALSTNHYKQLAWGGRIIPTLESI